MLKLIFGLLILSVLVACQNDPDIPQIDESDGGLIVRPEGFSEFGVLPETVPYPSDNPFSQAKEDLGRLLFWDPILSGNMDIACATCHHPQFAYADGLERSRGVNGEGIGPARNGGTLIDRNSPTILNTAFNGIVDSRVIDPSDAPMFWDLRTNSLEQQSIQPMLSAVEMRGNQFTEDEILEVVISRLENISEYGDLFSEAFGTSQITEDRIGAAIATFERSILANNSRFDQYLGGDLNILSDQEIEGMELFIEVGCIDCHGGPMLSDFELHILGVPNNGVNDRGANNNFSFRTPSLRNVALTAPYMHNGIFDDLDDVVEFYIDVSNRRNNAINNNVNINRIDNDARGLDIGRGDIAEIVSFMRTLTDNNFDRTIPAYVPSNLDVGGE